MSGFYEDLCNLFIRPVRQTYNDYDLGTYSSIQAPPSSEKQAIDKTSLSNQVKVSNSKAASSNINTQTLTLALSICTVLTDPDYSVILI